MTTKICIKCNEEKPHSDFYKHMGRCKVCHNTRVREWQKRNPDKVVEARNRWRSKPDSSAKELAAAKSWQKRHPKAVVKNSMRQCLRVYGLSVEDYYEMVNKQSGKCYICGIIPSRRLYVDHNHTTGKVRKLLCSHCNLMLGMVKESTETLEKAIQYLHEHAV